MMAAGYRRIDREDGFDSEQEVVVPVTQGQEPRPTR